MSKWETVKLGDICDYISKGIAPRYTENISCSILVLNQKCNRDSKINFSFARLNDITKKKVPTERILKKYDILINSTGTGTAGRIAQIKCDIPTMTVDGHMIIFRTVPTVDAEYIGYALMHQQKKIENFAEGSTGQTEINKARLLDETQIPLPPLDEQKRIASILSSLDDKIENNNRINKNLEEQAQAIFKSWFVDFEPFGGVMPSDWREGTLSDVIKIKYGKDHKKLLDGKYPVYGSGGIMRYVETPLYSFESVLIPRKGTLNNVLYVNEPFWSVDTMFYTEMKFPNLVKFIFHFIKNKDLLSMNAGSAVPSMTTEILNKMELDIPSTEILEKFENLISPFYIMKKIYESENQKLAQLRDALLSKLMNGEMRV